MTDNAFLPPIPTTEHDCLYEVLRRTMTGLEYAALNPDQARSIMTDLHTIAMRAYVEGDGGRKALEQIYLADVPVPREFTYLASPYSSDGETKLRHEKERFEQACIVASELFRRGTHVFSPIAHGHPIKEIGGMLPGDYSYWKAYCQRTLAMCDTLTICKLDGWEASEGVTAEVALAKKMGKPIRELDPAPILAKWMVDHVYDHDPWPVTTFRKGGAL